MQSFEDSKNTQIPSRLSLKTVWDIRQGKEIDAVEFFKQPEGEIMNLRRQLQLAISTDKPLYVCPYCRQMVRLSGRKTDRGQVSFFSHLYDSDACFIKTTTGMTKEQIEASKYGLVSESARHKRLKSMIADLLQSEKSIVKGVSQVQVEKRINSPLPYMNWRCPDVQAKYNQFNLVFELQLSTTFISTIVDRDIFYRLNNYFIIWVFNFEDNQEYVNLSNLMCKDIYYANKRNVFIFDQEAQQKSSEEGELILKCNWLDPDNTWHFSQAKNHKDGILITLDQLQYDSESGKPYYYDADAEYFKDHPEVIEKRRCWEMSREEIIRALMERETKEKDLYEGQDERLREETRKAMSQTGDCASVYKKNDKVGLSYGDVILVPPIYSSISEYNSYGYAVVYNNRHQGLVDKLGYSIIPCEANEIRFLSSDIIIYRKNPYWYLVGASTHIAPVRDYSSIKLESINDSVDCISFGHADRKAYILLKNRFVIYEEKKGEYTVANFTGEPIRFICPIVEIAFLENLILLGCKMKVGVSSWKGHFYDKYETFYGVYNYSFNELVAPQKGQTISTGFHDHIVISCKSEHCSGVLSGDGAIIIPLEYDEVFYLGGSYYKAKKSLYKDKIVRLIRGKQVFKEYYSSPWGLLSSDGKVILSFEFEDIDFIEEHDSYIVMKDGKKGIMDDEFNLRVPYRYEDIASLGKSYYKVRADIGGGEQVSAAQKWGIISDSGDVVIPFEYDEIGDLFYGFFTIRQNGKKGVMNINLNVLIPCIYGDIKPLNDSLFKARLSGGYYEPENWGVISSSGDVLLPFQYEDIEDIVDGYIKISQFGKNGTKKGIIDRNCQVIIPCGYDDISPWGNTLFLVTRFDSSQGEYGDTSYYLINSDNVRINDQEYREISELRGSRAVAYKTGGIDIMILDADGQEIAMSEDEKERLVSKYFISQ